MIQLNPGVLWTGDKDVVPGAQDAIAYMKDQVRIGCSSTCSLCGFV